MAGIGIEPANGSIWVGYAVKAGIAFEEKLYNFALDFNDHALHGILHGAPYPA
jgi:hypothetical protein